MSNSDVAGPGSQPSHQVQNYSGITGTESPHNVRGRPEEFNFLRTLLHNLIRTTLIAVVPSTLIVVVGVSMWLSTGIRPLKEAANAMYTAETNYFATLMQCQPAMSELGARGAPTGEIEVVYFAFIDSPPEEKAHHGDVLLQVLYDQAEAVRVTHGDAGRTYDLLRPSTQARNRATLAYHAWVEVTKKAASRFAVWFNLGPAPTEAHQRYSRPLDFEVPPPSSDVP